MQECRRLGKGKDESRLHEKRVEQLEAEKQSLTEALKKLEQRWEMQDRQIREMTLQLEAKAMKGDGFQASAEKLHSKLKQAEQELSGVQAQCERLQTENNRLFEHIAYTEDQLNKAKDVISAKQVALFCCGMCIDGRFIRGFWKTKGP